MSSLHPQPISGPPITHLISRIGSERPAIKQHLFVVGSEFVETGSIYLDGDGPRQQTAELRLFVDTETRKLVTCWVAAAHQWDEYGGFDRLTEQALLRYATSLAGTKLNLSAHELIERVERILSPPAQCRRHDCFDRIEKASLGELASVIPVPLQARVARSLIAGKWWNELFENLSKFHAVLPDVVWALTEDRERAIAVAQSLTAPDRRGLAPLKGLPGMVGSNLLHRLMAHDLTDSSDPAAAEALQTVLSQFERFRRSDRVLVTRQAARLFEHVHDDAFLAQVTGSAPEFKKAWLEEIGREVRNTPGRAIPLQGSFALKHLDLFPAEAREELFITLALRDLEGVFRVINPQAWAEMNQNRVAAEIIAALGCETFKRYIRQFHNLDTSIARLILGQSASERDVAFFMYHLGSFARLDRDIGLRIGAISPARAFENAGKFKLNADDVRTIVEGALGSEKFEATVPALRSLPESLLQPLEREHHFIEFLHAFPLATAELYSLFLMRRAAGDRPGIKALQGELRELLAHLIGNQPQPADLAKRRFFSEACAAVFPNHGRFHTETICPDRTFDLAPFKVRPVYQIDLSEGTVLALRRGEKLDARRFQRIKDAVERAILGVGGIQGEKRIRNEIFRGLVDSPAVLDSAVPLESVIVRAVMRACLDGAPLTKVQSLLLHYHFYEDARMRAYCEGTRARNEAAPNQEYASRLILREFLSDTLRDTAVKLAHRAAQSEDVAAEIAGWARGYEEREEVEAAKQALARIRADRIGVTGNLLKDLERITQTARLSGGKRREALAKRIRSEQERLAQAIEIASGAALDAEDLHLLTPIPDVVVHGRAALPDGPQFLAGVLNELFRGECGFLDCELKKFAVEAADTSRQMKRLDCYISKNMTSAFARGVAGVCVCVDSPEDGSLDGKSQWNLPNFFLLVIYDPAIGRCEGAVLLHYYEERGKKILTGSFNPCSTLLFKVDEVQLFQKLLDCLITFAKDNDIDYICTSREATIRTNRTAGRFEGAMKKRIAALRKQYTLARPADFSFFPRYRQQDLDILWVNPKEGRAGG